MSGYVCQRLQLYSGRFLYTWLSNSAEAKRIEVDTGWVTDMAPDGVGTVAATHETWIGPPLDEEDEIAAAVRAYTSLLVQTCSPVSAPLRESGIWLSSFVQDGAARVLDPLFSHLKDPTWLLRGKFLQEPMRKLRPWKTCYHMLLF